MNSVLSSLSEISERWYRGGFAALYPEFAEHDFLRGREVVVLQTDDDTVPIKGLCHGIASDGSLLVGGVRVYAGEVHW